MDEHADAGDDDHHAGGKLVELDADVDGEVADGRPGEMRRFHVSLSSSSAMTKVASCGGDGNDRGEPGFFQDELVRRRDGEREEEEDPGEIHGR